MSSQKSASSLVVKSNLQAGRVGIGTFTKDRALHLFHPALVKTGKIDHTVSQ